MWGDAQQSKFFEHLKAHISAVLPLRGYVKEMGSLLVVEQDARDNVNTKWLTGQEARGNVP